MTGVYDSLERDEAANIIKEYGGKVTTSLSKKTTYIVLGEDAGLAKIAKAEELGTAQLTEDGLLDLIRTKSGLPSKEIKSESTPPKESKYSTSKGMTNGENSKSRSKESPKKKVKEEKNTPKKNAPSSQTSNASAKKIKVEGKTPKTEGSGTSATIVHKNVKFEKSEDIPVDRKLSVHQQNIASDDNKAWVEKYKPTNIKQIIGQQGAASNVAK